MTPTKQDEAVEVVVKPNNRYGEAKAGDRLYITRRELEAHSRCLELVGPPPAPTPRTAVVSVRADVAQMLGLPMGRRQEGPLTYEVTRLPPDGKPRLPSRQELEAQAQGGGITSDDLDSPAGRKLLARAQKYVDEERDRTQREASEHVQTKLREGEELARAHVEEVRESFAKSLEAAREEIAKLQKDLARTQGELAAAKAQAAPAPAPAQASSTPPAAPPLPKGKREP